MWDGWARSCGVTRDKMADAKSGRWTDRVCNGGMTDDARGE